MPSRKAPLITGEYYHVFNRGVAKLPIANDTYDFKRFIHSMQYYRLAGPKPRFSLFDPKKHQLVTSKHIVEIYCFCIMPNHFHLLLRQEKDNGISEFVSKLSNSYTKYINTRYKRVGHLFQGEFKAVRIESDEQLLHVSRYIHLNPVVSYLVVDVRDYPWSSYGDFIGKRIHEFINAAALLRYFQSRTTYEMFVLNQEDYAKILEEIKHLTFE